MKPKLPRLPARPPERREPEARENRAGERPPVRPRGGKPAPAGAAALLTAPKRRTADQRAASRGRLPLPVTIAKGLLIGAGQVLATLLMVGIITGCIVGCVLTVYILQYIGADNSVDLDAVRLGYTSLILATDPETGEDVILKRLYRGGEDRTWVDYEDISENALKAVVAIEDKRFWDHDGVDWRRTVGGFVGMFMPIEGTTTGGGSTITQQLIKNVTGDNDYSVERKVREIFRAMELHKHYTREDILEAYMNLVPLGNGTNGIQAAANFYFDKTAAELTIAESAALVGITKFPGLYNPYRNPVEHQNRMKTVLWEMFDQKRITQAEYDAALKEKLNFVDHSGDSGDDAEVDSFFVDHVVNEATEDLMEAFGWERTYASQQLYSGGYRIYATVDLEMQEYIEEFFLNLENFPSINMPSSGEYPQSATAIIDPTGRLLAVVGSNREKTESRSFNRATMSRRHPGSSIKPIGPYAQAFERNNIYWSFIIEDGPITGGPNGWSPENYYGGFIGPVTVDRAIQNSINTVATKVVQMVTPRRVFNFLHNDLQFEGLVEREVVGERIMSDVELSPMALGALTYGVSPLEMAGAYQIFVNGGQFTKPYSYTRIMDFEGNIILEKDTMPAQVMQYDTAVVLNKLLQRVVTGPYGTGSRARINGMPTAGKTGTSQDNVNQWFMGFTPYYIAPAWLGYDSTTRVYVDANGRRSIIDNSVNYNGLTYPPPVLWNSFMTPLHEGLEPKPFIESPNVVSHVYCTQTGDLATAYCPVTDSGWYKTSRVPRSCLVHTSDPLITGELEGLFGEGSAPGRGGDPAPGSAVDGTNLEGRSIFDFDNE